MNNYYIYNTTNDFKFGIKKYGLNTNVNDVYLYFDKNNTVNNEIYVINVENYRNMSGFIGLTFSK